MPLTSDCKSHVQYTQLHNIRSLSRVYLCGTYQDVSDGAFEQCYEKWLNASKMMNLDLICPSTTWDISAKIFNHKLRH